MSGYILALDQGTTSSRALLFDPESREHVTDVSNAARTLLFNIDRGDWDDALLARFKIPRALLPRVVPSSGVLGETRLFGAPLPIAGVAGDQQAATFGQACFTPGLAKNTYGTGCFAVMNTGERRVDSEQGLLTTIGWQLEPGARLSYALEGGVFIAGAAVQWLRDELGIIASAAEIEPLAAQVAEQPRGLLRAGLRGPGHAALGPLRPRRRLSGRPGSGAVAPAGAGGDEPRRPAFRASVERGSAPRHAGAVAARGRAGPGLGAGVTPSACFPVGWAKSSRPSCLCGRR
jgi:sugar (pentulose or hexulose) kinase